MIARVTKDGREQSLLQHSLAVAYWAELFGAKIDFKCLMRLAGLLHDAGKSAIAFQEYLMQVVQAYAGLDSMPQRGSVIHSTQAAKLIFERHIASQDIVQRITAEILAMILASHHGYLPDSISPKGTTPLRNRLLREDLAASTQQSNTYLIKELLTETDYQQLFEGACNEMKAFFAKVRLEGLDIRFSLHLLVKHLFSCLVDADRYDAYCFEAQLEVSIGDVDNIVVPDWAALAKKLETHVQKFTDNSPINQLRANVSKQCLNAAQYLPGVYQLNVPTGGGKTLASLRFALNHAAENKMSRIIYIIPYLSILEQTTQTVREILGDNELLEHHSNLLPEAKGEDYSLLTERWDSKLIFSTMVQFLESVFSGSTRGLRKMHHLAGAVLVFDEIQSLPLNCVHLFNGTINYLSRVCDSTVLLCTATPPRLKHTQRPLLLKVPKMSKMSKVSKVSKVSKDANIVLNLNQRFSAFQRVQLLDARIPGGYAASALAVFVVEKLKELSNGLVILNTRKDVTNLYQALKELNSTLPKEKRYKLYHLSTSMCPAHRLQVLDEVKRRLGKERLICVSTQLIEAGVDISFECVIRALAGLDSILQALGRCNRNGEYLSLQGDPLMRDCYVVNVAGEDLTNLPDIQCGAGETERILDEIKADPSAYDGNPLSLAAIERYYETYLYKRAYTMDFGIEKLETSLYDLLSANRRGVDAFGSDSAACPLLLPAFETAGENFYVIEKSVAVLVPYSNGDAIILELSNEDVDIKRKQALLRTAGRYSINLFDGQVKQLRKENGLVTLEEGVLALSDGYYDTEIGFHADRRLEPEKHSIGGIK